MPHLAFYPAADDVAPVLEFVLGQCTVFEAYSLPGRSLRTFYNVASVLEAAGGGSRDLMSMLYSPAMSGAPVVRRLDLNPGTIPGACWREEVSGWGLIQLLFSAVRKGDLSPSRTNHDSETRARRWKAIYPELSSVDAWDFHEVARISRRINRHISKLAVRKHGARPVLPAAQGLLDARDVVLSLN